MNIKKVMKLEEGHQYRVEYIKGVKEVVVREGEFLEVEGNYVNMWFDQGRSVSEVHYKGIESKVKKRKEGYVLYG